MSDSPADYSTNGFHDTGNAIATSIATKAMSPRIAVALSGVLNLVRWPGRRYHVESPATASAPFWVILSCGLAISLGTYMGGWRVTRTLGKGLVEIESPAGHGGRVGRGLNVAT